MTKYKKTLIVIVLILISFIFNYKKINARMSPSIAGGEKDISGIVPSISVDDVESGNGNRYKYSYKRILSYSTDISIGAYNKLGKEILTNSGKIETGEKFLSGTWIGISLIQTSDSSYTVRIDDNTVQEKFKVYECKQYCSRQITLAQVCKKMECYGTRDPNGNCQGREECIEWTGGGAKTDTITKTSTIYGHWSEDQESLAAECDKKNLCPEGYTKGDTSLTLKSGEYYYEDADESNVKADFDAVCEQAKKDANRNSGSRAELFLKDSNDINKTTLDDIRLTSTLDEDKSYDTHTPSNGTFCTGNYHREYEIMPNNVCMNVKTGNVRYDTPCNKENEVKIPFGDGNDGYKYFHYFIPLNTKTTSNFVGIVAKGDFEKKFDEGQCKKMIDNYPDIYYYMLKTTNGQDLSTNKTIAKEKVRDGCIFNANITFPVQQKFYYEKYNKFKEYEFEGYNFYYRPIDIYNPFPNNPIENSWWNDWYKNINGAKGALDLSKSYQTKSYEKWIDYGTIKEIRNYNKNNKYPDFNGISVSGESNFLKTLGMSNVETTQGENKYYMLGAGENICIKDKKIYFPPETSCRFNYENELWYCRGGKTYGCGRT